MRRLPSYTLLVLFMILFFVGQCPAQQVLPDPAQVHYASMAGEPPGAGVKYDLVRSGEEIRL